MRRSVSLVFALAVIASPLVAQGAHPNFAGKWTLDPAASSGAIPVQAMSAVVTQDDKTIGVESDATTSMGEQKATQTINLDGSPSKNTIDAGGGQSVDLMTTATWEGETLVVTQKAQVQGQDVQQTDRWTLQPGGNTLQMDRSVSAAGQNFAVKLVFKKA